MTQSRADDRVTIAKAVAILIVCVPVGIVFLSVNRGGVGKRRADPVGIQVVRVPLAATHHADVGSSTLLPVMDGIAVRVDARERRWDDGGAILAGMAAELRAEARDAGWAGDREALLRTQLARIVPSNAPPAEVRCATTLCEVAGALPPPTPADDVRATLQSLQNANMRNALPDVTLVGGPILAHDDRGTRYKLYFRRRST